MPLVWQLSVIHLHEKTLMKGVILKNAPFTFPKPVNPWQNLWKLIQSFFIEPYRRGEIVVSWSGGQRKINTDKKGSFTLEVEGRVLGPVTISTKADETLEMIQRYPVQFDLGEGEVDVITDMDDTVLVSHTASLLKRIGTMALISPYRRKAIDFTRGVLTHFTNQGARVVYLSKSESNLFGMLSTFIIHQELPQGPMLLTPYLKLRQLFRPKKGKDYKYSNIDYLLRHSDKKRFVLIGDDSQRDMEIYTAVAKTYPERIVHIYIRQTGRKRSSRQRQQWEELNALPVPAHYFGRKEAAPNLEEDI